MQDTVMMMTMQGDDLRALRKGAGMTQAELAAAIGMTGTSIGLMERGAAPIERRTELAVLYVTEKREVIGVGVRDVVTEVHAVPTEAKP